MKLFVLRKLQKILNGECSTLFETCPAVIDLDMYTPREKTKWCHWCDKNFDWLAQLPVYEPTCPCSLPANEGEVLLHLDNIIEEMKKCGS